MDPTKILIVNDSIEDQQDLIDMISALDEEIAFQTAVNGDQAIAAFNIGHHDCIILGYPFAHENGLETLQRLKAVDPFCAVVMISSRGTEEVAAEAIKSGASDYLIKDKISGRSVRTSIQRTVERSKQDRKTHAKNLEQKQFLNTLVHDIRAPFTHIKNSTAMLIEDITNEVYADISQLVKIQAAALTHAEALIRTLQVYALLDDEIGFGTVQLKEVFDLLKTILLSNAQNSNVTLEVDSFPEIVGHTPQIMQLFQNLVSNAIKFNESAAPLVRISLAEIAPDFVTICVSDNGLGIENKNLSLIFQPLKRLWSNDEYSGTGLGLSICKKIIDRHGGNIWCESAPGQGSKFFVKLRRAVDAGDQAA